MEQAANALGQLLVRAVPTFVLVLLLYIFLKKFFFNPLASIIAQRYAETEGAMKAAGEGVAAAGRKAEQYQQALKEARAEMYRLQERERQQTLEECNVLVRQAREQAEQRVRAARQQLQDEAERAKVRLSEESEALAESITQRVLSSRAERAT